MSIHFQFLRSEWAKVYEAAAKTESLAYPDPRTACFYSRHALEIATSWLFECDNSLTQPYKTDLFAFLFEPSFKAPIGPALHVKLDVISKVCSGDSTPIGVRDAVPFTLKFHLHS